MNALRRISAAAPVRHVHLGLGNFFRAHQAAYTAHAPDAGEWGIAGFTGRRPDLARLLAAQDGLYTLTVRAPDGDRVEVVPSLSAVHAAEDHQRWLDYFADERVAVVTSTVTEAGYRRAADGRLDRADRQVAADLATLAADPSTPVATPPARLAAGLAARWHAGGPPLAVVPCDNLPGNGAATRTVVLECCAAIDDALAEWAGATVSFVDTVVDRITPRVDEPTAERLRQLAGVDDRAPVVAEPFSEWVLAGDFPTGRPDWAAAGAIFTADCAPYENRKLWLLNGAHSLLAYTAPVRGHETVADAIADDSCAGWVHQWWDEAGVHLSMPAAVIAEYRAALLARFGNLRIRHALAQIAADGSQKLPARVLPVVRLERAAGRLPLAAARVLAGWLAHLRGQGVPVVDPRAAALRKLAAGPVPTAVRRVLATLAPDLADDAAFADAVVDRFADLGAR